MNYIIAYSNFGQQVFYTPTVHVGGYNSLKC